jgi:hypothetical protein
LPRFRLEFPAHAAAAAATPEPAFAHQTMIAHRAPARSEHPATVERAR